VILKGKELLRRISRDADWWYWVNFGGLIVAWEIFCLFCLFSKFLILACMESCWRALGSSTEFFERWLSFHIFRDPGSRAPLSCFLFMTQAISAFPLYAGNLILSAPLDG
jgi:hypothetical protein